MSFFYEKRENRTTVLRGELEWGAHLHKHIEIVHMRQGVSDAYVDGVHYELHEGDCMIVFPNRIHTYRNGLNDIADVILVSPDSLLEYKGILSKKLPVSPCIRSVSDTVQSLFDAVYKCSGSFADSTVWGYCVAILGSLFEYMEFKKADSGESNTLQTLLDYCAENYKENISVESVAAELNLSSSYVSHIFSEKLFIGFRQYINSLRINDAIQLLRNGKLSTTEIAYETGFGTTRTFNRAFTASIGCSPSEYRRRLGNE